MTMCVRPRFNLKLLRQKRETIEDLDVCSHDALAQRAVSAEDKPPPLLPVNDTNALAQAQTLQMQHLVQGENQSAREGCSEACNNLPNASHQRAKPVTDGPLACAGRATDPSSVELDCLGFTRTRLQVKVTNGKMTQVAALRTT